jgi:hypothetical protein
MKAALSKAGGACLFDWAATLTSNRKTVRKEHYELRLRVSLAATVIVLVVIVGVLATASYLASLEPLEKRLGWTIPVSMTILLAIGIAGGTGAIMSRVRQLRTDIDEASDARRTPKLVAD